MNFIIYSGTVLKDGPEICHSIKVEDMPVREYRNHCLPCMYYHALW